MLRAQHARNAITSKFWRVPTEVPEFSGRTGRNAVEARAFLQETLLERRRKRETHMKSILLAGALAVAATAAYAQTTAKHYYIVQDATAKKCMVVDTMPQKGGSTTVVAEGKTYVSEADANNAMKTMTICKAM